MGESHSHWKDVVKKVKADIKKSERWEKLIGLGCGLALATGIGAPLWSYHSTQNELRKQDEADLERLANHGQAQKTAQWEARQEQFAKLRAERERKAAEQKRQQEKWRKEQARRAAEEQRKYIFWKNDYNRTLESELRDIGIDGKVDFKQNDFNYDAAAPTLETVFDIHVAGDKNMFNYALRFFTQLDRREWAQIPKHQVADYTRIDSILQLKYVREGHEHDVRFTEEGQIAAVSFDPEDKELFADAQQRVDTIVKKYDIGKLTQHLKQKVLEGKHFLHHRSDNYVGR